MATDVQFCCTDCKHRSPKWLGRCPECGAWNSYQEQTVEKARRRARPHRRRASRLDAPEPEARQGEVRVKTGLGELDRVLGGGLVSGSLTLIGGDPGVGKSTLLLMALDALGRLGLDTLYISAEESESQVRLRSRRLGIEGRGIHLLAETDLEAVLAAVDEVAPRVVVLDSVQTLHAPESSGVPGSMSQVREVAVRAMRLAKGRDIATLLVGHVTKQGGLAGPKALEHLVDTVISFEGDGRSSLRVLRASKNRFGPTGEVGLFEMRDVGLVEVPDASARLLGERSLGAPGTAILPSMEGTRPLLVELQALVSNPGPGNPARSAVGVDRGRMTMLLAVLGKLSLGLQDRDVFLSAAGGVRVHEPAADLGLIAAVASSLEDKAIDPGLVLFGEVGLVGEVRAVSHPSQRLREAGRHGFTKAVVPASGELEAPPGMEIKRVRSVREALDTIL